jgi:hypothetical protein
MSKDTRAPGALQARERRKINEPFAAIPVDVLRSEACASLPNYAVRVLLIASAQYRGVNNGDIAITWSTACEYGLCSKWQLVRALDMLLERGLLIKTRQGGRRPLGPTLYALGWRPIDDLRKFDPRISPTATAPNGWQGWTAGGMDRDCRLGGNGVRPKFNGTSGGPLRDPRRTVKRLQRDPGRTVKSVEPKFNGTSGGPPLRSDAYHGGELLGEYLRGSSGGGESPAGGESEGGVWS